jgi:hypothetical protein
VLRFAEKEKPAPDYMSFSFEQFKEALAANDKRGTQKNNF